MTGGTRPEIAALASYGPLPPESDWSTEALERFGDLIVTIHDSVLPLRDSELPLLLPLFDRPVDDDLHGMCGSIRSVLESAPSYDRTIEGLLARYETGPSRPLFEELLIRLENGRRRSHE